MNSDNRKINGTNFEVGQRAKVVNNSYEKDDKGILIGLEGELTHPFATGCTAKEWVGFRSDKYTPWGFHLNFHMSELELISPENEKMRL